MSEQNAGLNKRCAIHGLSRTRSELKAIEKRGIYCQPAVSIKHPHLANRYVLRGVESGGWFPMPEERVVSFDLTAAYCRGCRGSTRSQ